MPKLETVCTAERCGHVWFAEPHWSHVDGQWIGFAPPCPFLDNKETHPYGQFEWTKFTKDDEGKFNREE